MRANGIPINIFVELFWYEDFLLYTWVGIMKHDP
jgi:hypothetical protein